MSALSSPSFNFNLTLETNCLERDLGGGRVVIWESLPSNVPAIFPALRFLCHYSLLPLQKPLPLWHAYKHIKVLRNQHHVVQSSCDQRRPDSIEKHSASPPSTPDYVQLWFIVVWGAESDFRSSGMTIMPSLPTNLPFHSLSRQLQDRFCIQLKW